MRLLPPAVAGEYFVLASKQAALATCKRSRCGSVVVDKDGKVIGEGFNSPAGNLESQRRCLANKDLLNRKVTDKTCCVHAEQRAILDALRRSPKKVAGSTLYFIRLGPDGRPSRAGDPYCTICSKMALEAGIAEFVLWHDGGPTAYRTDEYNLLSYKYTDGK